MDESQPTTVPPSDQQFAYSPLDPGKRAFRLLTLLPAQLHDAEISCTVEMAEITFWSPSFDALSYTWGVPGDDAPQPILLNGRPKTVSRNLDAALRALRSGVKNRVLWVDAVCINQQDDEEKARQVAMMDLIYSKAASTLVWLGAEDESEGSRVAIEKLCGIKSNKDLLSMSDRENEAIGMLLTRAWFSRVWVVQEFSLAKKVVFYCGDMAFDWAPIEKVLKKLVTEYRPWRPVTERESKKPDSEVLDNLSQSQVLLRLLMDRRGVMREASGGFTREKTFQLLVEKHIHLNATVPHDRIYGLLALGKKMNISLSNAPAVTYTASTTSVNVAWAKWMIERSQKLDILFACQKTNSEPGLPSWAPSWRARDDSSFIPTFASAMLLFYASTKILIKRAENNKQVTIQSPKFSFTSEDDDVHLLSLHGKRMATLTDSCAFHPVEPEYFHKLTEFLPDGYISGEPQSVWRDYRERITRESAVNAPRINGVEVKWIKEWKVANDYAAAKDRTPARLEKLKYVVEKNRVRFVDGGGSKGGREGLVPKETRKGDVLVLFRGMETPFVVRPVGGDGSGTGNRYRVVGEAFVEGYMKGRKNMGEKETFVLC